MNVKFENNVLTVNTGIPVADLKKAKVMKVTNEDGNEVFAIIAPGNSTNYSICVDGLKCNATIDEKAAIVAVFPDGTTLDNIKDSFGDALVAAAQYIPKALETYSAREAAIAAVFQ